MDLLQGISQVFYLFWLVCLLFDVGYDHQLCLGVDYVVLVLVFHEIVWAEINIAGTKKIIIGFYYRPPSDNVKSLDNLDESLNRLKKYHASNIWLGGDFNLAK
jgi:hypothetical protein